MFSFTEAECSDLVEKVARTINTLRHMRGAGNDYSYLDIRALTPLVLLADAQILVETASDFLVPYIAREVEASRSAPWMDILEQLETKYEKFMGVHSGGQTEDIAARRTLNRVAMCSHIDGYYTAGQMYLDNNGVSCRVPDFTEGIGIVAPLSVDYLAASCFARFIGSRFQVPCPNVQPVLLDADRKEIVGCGQIDPRLTGERKVVILLDALNRPSQTMQAMEAFARTYYPQQYRSQHY